MESMASSTVAILIKYFNIASIVVLALFAALGIFAIFRWTLWRVNAVGSKTAKMSQKAVLKSSNALLYAFCVATLVAFAVEATFFNFQHYIKYFAGPELQTLGTAPENPNLLLTSGGVTAEILTEKDKDADVSRGGVIFKNLNMNVTSVFVEIGLGKDDASEMVIEWTDGLSNANRFVKKLNKHIPYDNYTPLQPQGKVLELKIMFTATGKSNTVELSQIVLNKQIPFNFSGLRLIVASFLFFAVICLFRKEPRAKAAYYLFEYKFNPDNLKQNLIHALSVIGLIVFSYLCINTSYKKSYFDYPVHQQYNKFLVDALLNGRTWLDYGTPENLLKAERPYDNAYRIANGYKFNSDVMWDWTWYKGKFYCYYGVVPAVILYLPYKLITGEYLSNNGGIFLFTSVIIVLMAMLWRFCVKKYMPNAGFAFYILSFLVLFFASGIFVQLRFTRFYSIAQTAGLMFTLAGFLLLLKSTENGKINRVKLFFACLCLALVVGCRPNMIFVSLFVPIVLWKHRSWKLFSFVTIPYVIVAIPLCIYNYVRFDSIFEFGIKYVLSTYSNGAGNKLIFPFGKIILIFRALVYYILAPGLYSLSFPFVESCPLQDEYVMGMLYLQLPGIGMVNFPIVFCALYLFKNILNKKQATQQNTTQNILWGVVVVAAITAIVDAFAVGFQGRYLLDFAVFVILPSLFCAYYWCADADNSLQNRNRQSVVHILLALSIFVGLFLCVSGTFAVKTNSIIHYDPVLYRYLEYSLGIFRNV